MTDLLTLWHQNAAHPTDDARRQLQQRIRAAWREERARGTHNPPDELGLDLDSLSDDDLVALRNAVQERIAVEPGMGSTPQPKYAGLPELPHGWRWVGRYRAEHPDHGRTATYNDARLLFKALRKRVPKTEKREAPAERVQGELFSEER